MRSERPDRTGRLAARGDSVLEGHDAAGDLAAPETVVRLVDLIQRVLARDHLFDLQLAGQGHVDEAADVDAGARGPVPRPKQPRFLLHEEERIEAGGLVLRGHTDDHRCASRPDHLDRLLDGLRVADDLEREVHAAVRQVKDVLYGIVL